ncbi:MULTISPECIES: hypothetical protein [unclassified Chelatococcus]|uniref:hypothetical protein n=1 Tax=unclassified Chelatococcus TaxID=2638111 RepID=UPI001BCF1BCC|nr:MULTISPECIES: hypothetical protein [unclassified Chelatococcus]MBS7698134.1 hypothetical protein [Chelatococcus sp. YT9]MBX3556548.1 hypothetical protein [Chelatococcus sp.]
MTSDSLDQLDQARRFAFSDWHPPVMALIWHYTDRLIAGPAGLFTLILGLYWLGFWLMALRYGRSSPFLGYVILLAGISPILIAIPAMVWKDSLLFACFLPAAALLAASASRKGPARLALIAIALVLLLIGSLARHNAILAAAPLIMLGIWHLPPARPSRAKDVKAISLRLVAMMVATVATTSFAGWLLNRHVLDARPSTVVNSLMAFDIVGIAARTGKNGLPGAWTADEDQRVIHSCYEPRAWDSLAWGQCSFVVKRLVTDGHWQQGLMRHWIAAISDHPVAYLRHRLAHARQLLQPLSAAPPTPQPTSFTYGFTANDGFRWIQAIITTASNTPLIGDLTRGGLWIIIGMATCAAACLRGLHRWMARDAALLSLSGVLYGLPLVIVGVATEFRYFYWTIGAVLIAVLVLTADLLKDVSTKEAGSTDVGADQPTARVEPQRA